uniref:Uncharacterized protein n=1 Tax=Oryza sativa subsp. japonica TaxID=39947 RepID=Q6K7T2_ORYSJ|nr:hypothetical protein [Oryza sativa Japonica Group]BAD21840.1 hypothetical protein [Oryza sativa Japonica Group]
MYSPAGARCGGGGRWQWRRRLRRSDGARGGADLWGRRRRAVGAVAPSCRGGDGELDDEEEEQRWWSSGRGGVQAVDPAAAECTSRRSGGGGASLPRAGELRRRAVTTPRAPASSFLRARDAAARPPHAGKLQRLPPSVCVPASVFLRARTAAGCYWNGHVCKLYRGYKRRIPCRNVLMIDGSFKLVKFVIKRIKNAY